MYFSNFFVFKIPMRHCLTRSLIFKNFTHLRSYRKIMKGPDVLSSTYHKEKKYIYDHFRSRSHQLKEIKSLFLQKKSKGSVLDSHTFNLG